MCDEMMMDTKEFLFNTFYNEQLSPRSDI